MRKNDKKEVSLQDEAAELKRQNKQLKKSLKKKDEEIAEIRKENSWLTTAVDITNVGVWDWDFKKEKIVFSPVFSSMMGYAGARVSDRINWLDMIHPEDVQSIRKKIKRALKDGKAELELQFRMKTKFQGWRWIHSNAKITEADSEKNPLRVIGINSDTTIRSHYEEALRGIQNVTQRIVNTIPDILYIYDLSEGRFTYVNEQTAQLFGYSTDEFTSMDIKHFAALKHPEESGEYKKNQQRIKKAKDGEIVESTFRIKTVSGGFRWLTSRSTVFSRTSDGAAEQVLGIAQDVTDRKEAEEALKSYENRFVKTLISAVEDERKRIARELHGGVIHLLMYANLKLELFQRENEQAGNAELNEVRETILKAGRELRAIVPALHTFVLDNYGLAQSAAQLCCEYEEVY